MAPPENMSAEEKQEKLQELATENSLLMQGITPGGKAPSGVIGRDYVMEAYKAITCEHVAWEEELELLLAPLAPSEQSFSKLHRGMFANGIDYPGYIWAEGTRKIAVVVDVSYSMDEVKLAKVGKSIADLTEETMPEEMLVVYCSNQVKATEVFGTGDEFRFNAKAGGGTLMEPGIQRVIEEMPDADALILFTDMELMDHDLQTNIDCQKLIISTTGKGMPSKHKWDHYKLVTI